jgi:hypothetical protein
MQLYISLVIIAAILVMEFATIATLGWPILRRKDAEFIRSLLPRGELNSVASDIISFWPESGYISSCGFSPFGTLYYYDYGRHVRIPWWTPLYKEVKAKYAELNAQEKN